MVQQYLQINFVTVLKIATEVMKHFMTMLQRSHLSWGKFVQTTFCIKSPALLEILTTFIHIKFLFIKWHYPVKEKAWRGQYHPDKHIKHLRQDDVEYVLQSVEYSEFHNIFGLLLLLPEFFLVLLNLRQRFEWIFGALFRNSNNKKR